MNYKTNVTLSSFGLPKAMKGISCRTLRGSLSNYVTRIQTTFHSLEPVVLNSYLSPTRVAFRATTYRRRDSDAARLIVERRAQPFLFNSLQRSDLDQ